MLDQRFLDGSTWGVPGARVEHVETHAAHVFLVGDRAYKIKKPVRLPYLDFSTRDKRADVLQRELDINRLFAPGIYLRVDSVLDEPVLVMRRFREEDVLASRISRDGLPRDLAQALAATIAESHRIAPRRDLQGAQIMRGLVNQLGQAFSTGTQIFDASSAMEFTELARDHLHRLAGLLDRRSDEGLVRRCHGDLHAGNIVILRGVPVLFDAIEFSENIATVDVLYDLAFILMDLIHAGVREAANVVFNHYLSLRRNEEDLSGLAALPLFLAIRAGVRALVTADRMQTSDEGTTAKGREEARGFLANCLSELQPPSPRLVAIGGLSGTGKSTLAAMLAPGLGAAPGALLLRSDVERKILAGVAETDRLPHESYSAESSRRTYASIIDRASRALAAGHAVIMDAVFAKHEEREAVEDMARRTGARFDGLWLDANPAQMKARVSARLHDASDADLAVVEKQMSFETGPVSWALVDAGGSRETTLHEALRALAI